MPRKYKTRRKFNQVAETHKESENAYRNRLKRELDIKNKKNKTGEDRANGSVSS